LQSSPGNFQPAAATVVERTIRYITRSVNVNFVFRSSSLRHQPSDRCLARALQERRHLPLHVRSVTEFETTWSRQCHIYNNYFVDRRPVEFDIYYDDNAPTCCFRRSRTFDVIRFQPTETDHSGGRYSSRVSRRHVAVSE
jgi:hypothetical protein